MRNPAVDFLRHWLCERPQQPGAPANVSVHDEQAGARKLIWDSLRRAVADHFIDLSLCDALGMLDEYPAARTKVRHALPRSKRVRSGDLAEVLAAEYVDQLTAYKVPLRKLRYKDDRDMAMRLDDVVAVQMRDRSAPKLLRGEVKSRAKLSPGVVAEACMALGRHEGHPSPQTLSFIARRLDEKHEDVLARVFWQLLDAPPAARHVEHLVFTLSSNDPTVALGAHAGDTKEGIKRKMVGMVVDNHQDFINQVFESI